MSTQQKKSHDVYLFMWLGLLIYASLNDKALGIQVIIAANVILMRFNVR